MAKRSLMKRPFISKHLIPEEESFLVVVGSVLISPWLFVAYFCHELVGFLEDIHEDIMRLAGGEQAEETWSPREPEPPEGDDGVYVDIASVFNIDQRKN